MMAPESAPPHERILRFGPQALEDDELLAILLCGDQPDLSDLELARRLLAFSDGLHGLYPARDQLRLQDGVGDGEFASLGAAIELACRMARAEVPECLVIEKPDALARYLTLRYAQFDQEIMGAIYVDVLNRVIGERELFRGTMTQCTMSPVAVLKHGIQCGAAGFVLFHTHPVGDPTPSAPDQKLTLRLCQAAEVIGLRCLDHLILGTPGRWVSLRRYQTWPCGQENPFKQAPPPVTRSGDGEEPR